MLMPYYETEQEKNSRNRNNKHDLIVKAVTTTFIAVNSRNAKNIMYSEPGVGGGGTP